MEKINLDKVNYIQYGNAKGKDIILLHGWGQNIEMMEPLGNPLSCKYHITILDLSEITKYSRPHSCRSSQIRSSHDMGFNTKHGLYIEYSFSPCMPYLFVWL